MFDQAEVITQGRTYNQLLNIIKQHVAKNLLTKIVSLSYKSKSGNLNNKLCNTSSISTENQ